MKRTLYFRLIKDPSLDLNTRILYTYLFKWANVNHLAKSKPDRYTFKPITKRRMLRATGFNWKTISKCLNTLISKKYVDARYAPLLNNPNLMKSADGKVVQYRKLQWEGKTDIKRKVAKAFIRSQDEIKSVSPNYFVTVLGLSRRSVFRMKQALTVGTGALTVGTDERLQLAPKALTVGTVSNTGSNTVLENPKINTPVAFGNVTECLDRQKDNDTPLMTAVNDVNEWGEEILGSFFANLCHRPPTFTTAKEVEPVDAQDYYVPPAPKDEPVPDLNHYDPYAINYSRPAISYDEATQILEELGKIL